MVNGFLNVLTLPKSVTVAVFVATAIVLEPWMYQPLLLNDIDAHWVLLLNFAFTYTGVLILIWAFQYQSYLYPKFISWVRRQLSTYALGSAERAIILFMSQDPDKTFSIKSIYKELQPDYEKVTIRRILDRLTEKDILFTLYTAEDSLIKFTDLGLKAAEYQLKKRRDTT